MGFKKNKIGHTVPPCGSAESDLPDFFPLLCINLLTANFAWFYLKLVETIQTIWNGKFILDNIFISTVTMRPS